MRRPTLAVAAAAACLLAGCGGFVPGGEAADRTTVTPAPTPTPEPTATPTPTLTTSGAVQEPRYLGLRPTCERPPGLVIAIQVGALRNNDPATNEGINTTWRFASPENRRATGPLSNFVEIIRQGYRPLLEADRVAYGPLERSDATATQTVTVTANGTTTSYEWTLRLQTDGQFEGCWMTTGVAER
jgi:hypothetical protein